MVHFSSYKAVPHTEGCSHDHFMIASDLTRRVGDTIRVKVSGLGKAYIVAFWVAFSSYNTNLQEMLVTRPGMTLCDPEGVIRPEVTSQGFGRHKYPCFLCICEG